ncbi:MAG: shikimate dehydrogenase [Rikenellaceae bacterium]
MKHYGLIGFPLGHSFSAKYFAERFTRENILDCSYSNFPLENISQLGDMLAQNPDLKGFNVTIPYKLDVIPYLKTISDEAKAIGAVNCVKIDEGGELYGYNTDVYGFRKSLLELIGESRSKALVLGTGGASRAVKYALESLGIEFLSVSRTVSETSIDYSMITAKTIKDYPLIINTTPLGTFPKVEGLPSLPFDSMDENNFLFDLVYNPETTRFMSEGLSRGAKVMNGYRMLVLQAEKSWDIWSE